MMKRNTWIVSLLLAIGVLVAIAGALVPFYPIMPHAGLDASWSLAMNVAAGRGLAFGTEIAFTFGPLSALYTHFYSPANYGLVVALSLWTALCLAVCVATLLWGRPVASAVALAVVYLCAMDLNAVMLFYSLAYVCFVAKFFGRDARRTPYEYAAACLLSTPIAIAVIVKGSFIASSVIGLALVVAQLVLARRFVLVALVAAADIAVLLLLWRLSGQHLDTLGPYIAAMAPIISGYTEAMAISGAGLRVVLYLVLSFFVLYTIALNHRFDLRSPRLWIDGLAFAAFLFLAFKAGFVRHDGHEVAAASALFLVTIPMMGTVDAAVLRQGAFASLVAGLMIGGYLTQGDHVGYTPGKIVARALNTVRSVFAGSAEIVAGDRNLPAAYAQALASIREDHPLRPIEGTADIYSYDQALLIASEAEWDPRPVFQSYSAYDPVLLEMNRGHLEGRDAPDTVVFAVQPIDGRMASLDDGASWPTLVSTYQIAAFDGTYAYLRKRPEGALALARTSVAPEEHRLGEAFQMPPAGSGDAAFAYVEVRPSLAGKIAQLLFKATPLSLELTMVDGSKRSYRTIAGMMKTGFVISPVVAATADFVYFASGNADALAGARVKSAAITPALPWLPLWSSVFTVRYDILHLPRETLPPDIFPEHAEIPRPARESCNGVIDYLNGSLLSGAKEAPAQRVVSVEGWLASASGIDGVPTDVSVEVDFADGTNAFYPASRKPRPDVNRHLGDLSLPDVGYTAQFDIGTKAASSIRIVAKKDSAAVGCSNLAVRMTQ